MNYIKSTAVATSGLYYEPEDIRTMLRPLPMRYPKPVDTVACYQTLIADVPPQDLTRLHLIELHPERASVDYSTVEEDLDGTKIFEPAPPVFYRKLGRRLRANKRKLEIRCRNQKYSEL